MSMIGRMPEHLYNEAVDEVLVKVEMMHKRYGKV